MNPKKQILEFLKNAMRASAQALTTDRPHNGDTASADCERIREIFDGMSTGTARIVIEQELGERVSGKYKLQSLENKGRYYLATIIQKEGRTIATLLVDKQNGNVQFV